MDKSNYKLFIPMLSISFIIMYAVMFLNVDQADHIFLSLTRLYMSLLMVSPMAILMIIVMKHMYKNRKFNMLIILSSVLIFCLSLFFLRRQVLVDDQNYMRAMIPHHSSAILTSKHANIQDPELKKLSEHIIESQQNEIEQMKAIIARENK